MDEKKPFTLVCAECHAAFETAEAAVDHFLVTRHMNVPVDAESEDLQGFIEALQIIQRFAAEGPGADLPEGFEIRPVSRQDILDDDELSDDEKQDILRKVSSIPGNKPMMRLATDGEQHAAIVAEARRQVQEEGAGHDCYEWRMDGKCELCDRPLPLCGRCYDEVPTFKANCAEDPEKLKGAPIGMYHCPDCGAMVLAGLPHPDLCQRCLDRTHPSFDPPPDDTRRV